jgi:hypothetical protein
MNPFEFVKSITTSGINIVDGLDIKEEHYNPFIVNRALSYHHDCVYFANEINKIYHVDKMLQYETLLAVVRKGSRKYKKWPKTKYTLDQEAVMEYYACNGKRAKEYLQILSSEQIKIILKRLDKGVKK